MPCLVGGVAQPSFPELSANWTPPANGQEDINQLLLHILIMIFMIFFSLRVLPTVLPPYSGGY